ncbi:MAG: M28 family peptidase [Planctomycetota bacterium]
MSRTARLSAHVLPAALLTLSSGDAQAQGPAAAAEREAELISAPRQLIYEGRRSGEGYFSRDGNRMVFQSEREPGNPFYQIYLLDLETGDVERVSPGHGKTTCAWIHPDNDRVLYATTHTDPEARAKQQAELDFRATGKERRYAWDYDESFELFAWSRQAGSQERLTFAPGYDAEGSYSPDGEWICFASNRAAYLEPLSEADRERLQVDKSLFMDLYLMRSDGRDVRRLTFVRGYDGGPFFSHDGSKICWRRFTEDGLTAEVWTMNTDGTDQQQLTELGAMSWAPFFHPSGEYLIFTTNRHGFANFELYLVDAEGSRAPVRVTYTPGFDGLPAFSPDGNTIAWTSSRTSDKKAQLFIGGWDHRAAQALLAQSAPRGSGGQASVGAAPGAVAASGGAPAQAVRAADLRAHVEALCAPEMAGRRTGSEGARRAADYLAEQFTALGLELVEGQEFDAEMVAPGGKQLKLRGRNVVAVLRGQGGDATEPPIIVGAHFDHLGDDGDHYSRAQGDAKGALHPGADDNASGVAGLLEIAAHLAGQREDGALKAVRDVYFAAWSGEEIGLFGSRHFVGQLQEQLGGDSLRGKVCAYINLDMIGRLDDQLILSGVGSSTAWRREIERRNVPVGLPLALVDDVNLRTDTSAFYPSGVPILNAFTGAHEDYHRPSDTVDKLNFAGMERVTRLVALVVRGLARSAEEPDYVLVDERAAKTDKPREGGKPYLGTIPDYAGGSEGVLLDGCAEGGPAWKAGMRGGDVIVELNGEDIGDIYDYTDVLDTLQPDVAVSVVVLRDGERLELSITPGRRG